MEKSKRDLLEENDFLRRGGYAENLAKVIQTAIRCGAVAFSFWCLSNAISSFAGRNSEADVLINFLADIEVSNALVLLFGGGAVVYGYKQRKLKGDTVERLQSRIQELESKYDSHRTSSGLTERGGTNPKDTV